MTGLSEQNRALDLKPCPFCGGEEITASRIMARTFRAACRSCGTSVIDETTREVVARWNTRIDAVRQEGAYEPSDAEIREGESLDSVSYVIRKGETDQTAFARAARAEIVRLRRALSERQEGSPAYDQLLAIYQDMPPCEPKARLGRLLNRPPGRAEGGPVVEVKDALSCPNCHARSQTAWEMTEHLRSCGRPPSPPAPAGEVAREVAEVLSLRHLGARQKERLLAHDRVLIQSNGAFWRSNRAGYTDFEHAAEYTGHDAWSSTHHCGPEKGVRYYLLSALPFRGEGGGTGWLIERQSDDGLQYRMASRWDRDASKAMRFARKEDAEAFAAAFMGGQYASVAEPEHRIAEHRWG